MTTAILHFFSSFSVSFGFAEALLYSTYNTSPFRYSPSGWYILIGWSAG